MIATKLLHAAADAAAAVSRRQLNRDDETRFPFRGGLEPVLAEKRIAELEAQLVDAFEKLDRPTCFSS